ncbi:MAG: hypothetical protein OXF08_09300 [Bacteroidetes bacterium]|nr:hypothetical protein [Bacteroidota bacterium]
MADSEFRSYQYISQNLKDLGWDIRNPKRGGSVYTQGEFRYHDEILTKSLARLTPENIIVLEYEGQSIYWVVEAKRTYNQLSLALSEAKDYADKINEYSGGGDFESCT